MRLIFFFVLVSFVAWGQKTPATLISENDATTYSAPFRIRNAFNDQILSNVNQRTPVFLDSADITKRVKWFINGSHPTATTYNITLPNGSGTLALTSDLGGFITGNILGEQQVTLIDSFIDPVSFGIKIHFEGEPDGYSMFKAGSDLFGIGLISQSPTSGNTQLISSTGGGYMSIIGVHPDLGGRYLFRFSASSTSDAVQFTDFRPTKYGITYADDYSSGFTSRSLIDKGYADTKLFNVLTTTGDIIYSSSGTTPSRLPKGTEGTILRAGASVPAYSTFTIPDTISALSTFVSNTANVLTEVTPAAGQSIRVNAGGTAWEAYTPGSGSSVLSDITAATGANTINSGANHQIWDWDSLTSGTGMSFRSSSTGADSSTLKVVSIEKSGANANSSQTTTALNVSNTSTGTSATNVAGRFTASGGDNNYALDIDGGINWSNGANRSTWTQTHSGTQPGINLETNRNAAAVQFGIQNTNSGTSAETRFRLAGSGQTGWLAMAGGNNTASYGEGYRMALWNNANAGIIFGTNNTGRAVFTNDNKFVFGATTITSGADFDVNGNVIFSGSSRYLNFGTTAGSSGYGFRDNAGVIEFKNSGETWTPLGYLQPQEESGTSLTLDDLDVTQGIYTSNGSAVTITVPSDLPIGAVVTIMQEGAGTVSLSAGANVNIAGKTSTTFVTDFIWLWLYKKDGGISYYVGR